MGAGTLDSTPGWTTVNMTNDSAVVEAMMLYICVNPSNSSLPWHYVLATQTFLRDQ
jgi:hypothetical protein